MDFDLQTYIDTPLWTDEMREDIIHEILVGEAHWEKWLIDNGYKTEKQAYVDLDQKQTNLTNRPHPQDFLLNEYRFVVLGDIECSNGSWHGSLTKLGRGKGYRDKFNAAHGFHDLVMNRKWLKKYGK
jgi:hypothetical protein